MVIRAVSVGVIRALVVTHTDINRILQGLALVNKRELVSPFCESKVVLKLL